MGRNVLPFPAAATLYSSVTLAPVPLPVDVAAGNELVAGNSTNGGEVELRLPVRSQRQRRLRRLHDEGGLTPAGRPPGKETDCEEGGRRQTAGKDRLHRLWETERQILWE